MANGRIASLDRPVKSMMIHGGKKARHGRREGNPKCGFQNELGKANIRGFR